VTFISQKCNQETREVDRWRDSEISKIKTSESGEADALDSIKKEHARRSAPLLKKPVYTEIVDHIDHMVNVAGIDHVGIGSDFDGSRTPTGMEDCTRVPFLTEEMIKRGYSDGDIQKILGLNVLRVMENVVDSTLVT
jgi:membrane dipeptidase